MNRPSKATLAGVEDDFRKDRDAAILGLTNLLGEDAAVLIASLAGSMAAIAILAKADLGI